MTTHPHDLRNAPRIKVFQRGEIRFLQEKQSMHMLNISFSGALLHSTAPPACGTLINVSCDRPIGVASVAWVSGQRLGIRFVRRLAQSTIDEILTDDTPQNAELPKAPI